MKVTLSRQSFAIRGSFRLSRGAKTAAEVVVAEIVAGGAVGRGEAVPYRRYGESVDGVMAAMAGVTGPFDRAALQRLLPPGAARNALDCALWDLEAKLSGRPVWQLAGLPQPRPVTTAYTLSLDSPAAMAAAAAGTTWPILKLKQGGDGDIERVQAVPDVPGKKVRVVAAVRASDEAAEATVTCQLVDRERAQGSASGGNGATDAGE